jgi:hypothetical protein
MTREEAVEALEHAAEALLAAADRVIFRPEVDDSRKVDQDLRALRAVLEPARVALARARGTRT